MKINNRVWIVSNNIYRVIVLHALDGSHAISIGEEWLKKNHNPLCDFSGLTAERSVVIQETIDGVIQV